MVLQIQITFTNGLTLESTKEPHFLGDAGIDGYITIIDQNDINFDIVKISLEGILVNTIRCSEWYAVALFQNVQKLLQLTDVKRPTDFVGSVGPGERPPKCFFHFEVPQCLDCELLGQNSGFLRDLPASFPCGERPQRSAVLQERCQGDCHVAYKLRVQALCQGEVLASSMQHIKIIPTLESRPPICVADFPGENALTKSRCLRAGFLGMHRTGDWRLEAGEPVSLVLGNITDHFSLSTSLNLTQTTYSNINGHEGKPKDVVDCQCTCSLISSTFISSVPRQSVPTMRELSTSNSLSRNRLVCAKTKIAVQFSKWREVAYTLHGENNSSEATTQWKSEAPVTLEFPNVRYLVPTFESALVSRRYKLAVDVQITKPRRTTFHLTLPVQIYYRTNEARRPWNFPGVESPPYVA